ncbi:MAG: AAA family ATPase [Acidimicrobiales bacterium]
METQGGYSYHPISAATRLSPPRLRDEVVHRSRLVDQILEPLGTTIVISGPAGSGKSTLLAQAYLAASNPAWLSIDPADNDPAHLWSAMTEAISRVIDGFGSSYLPFLSTPQSRVVDRVVPAAINELVDAAQPLVLFLDDIQLLENQECLDSIDSFVQLRPEHVVIVISGRTIPLSRLQRQRLEGHLVEIGSEQLNMDLEEARALAHGLDLPLDEAGLEQLLEHTEGWVAGLRWAAMALEHEPDLDRFLSAAALVDDGIGRYLVEEVLDQQPEELRAFLLESSILSHLSAGLCDAVGDRSDSGRSLEELERANAMVIKADHQDGWYRLHHLAREVLEARLQRESPQRAVELHRRAAKWLGEHDDASQAIHHALAAGDRTGAANFLCASWWDYVNGGRIETAIRLLDLFEETEIREYQPLAAAAAVVHGINGNDGLSRSFLHSAQEGDFDGKPPDGSASSESMLAITRSALSLDGASRCVADAELAYSLESADSRWRPLITMVLGLGRVWTGDQSGAVPYLEELIATGTTGDGLLVYALAEMALAHLLVGDTDAARATAESACQRAADTGIDRIFLGATAHGAAALAQLASGNSTAARTHLDAAIVPTREVDHAMPMDAMRTRLLLADASLQLDLVHMAATYLDGAAANEAMVPDTGVLGDQLAALRARLALATVDPRIGHLELGRHELAVAALLTTSKTNREIAADLYL